MDKSTRNYLLILIGIAMIVLIDWLSSLNPTVWEINDQLQADPVLSKYPYQFRLLSLEDGLAEMGSPRSASMPATRFLGIIYPGLANKSSNDEAMIAAQKSLAEHQAHAKKLASAHPQVTRVKWTLDKDWYTARGIPIQ